MFDNIPFISKKNEQQEQQDLREQDIQAGKDLETHKSSLNDDASYFHMQDNKSDLIRLQQDMDEDIYPLIMYLKGYIEEEGRWVKRMEPMCNDQFIYGVILVLSKPFMSKNMINSRLDLERIYKTMEQVSNDLADNMADGWDKYNIDFTNYDIIMRMFKTGVMASIQRAQSGWTKKVDSSMIKMVLTQKDGEQKGNKQVQTFLGG